MSTWRDQSQRLKGYLRPWPIILTGLRFLLKTRPAWLGGSIKLEDISAKDYVSGQLFQKFGSSFKAFETTTSVPSLVASAYGTVLEIGPGTGAQLDRFDKAKIEHIYGIELNPVFIPSLLAEAERVGLLGNYTVALGEAEDGRLLAGYGLNPGSIDSIVCIGTLCSVSNPERTMHQMYKMLKPGGVFIFWEHRRSNDVLTQMVQEFWNPLWRFMMGGCDLTRSIGDIIRDSGSWDPPALDLKRETSPECEWSIMPRVEGKLVKSMPHV